jgi:UDP-glucose 4-epimerase
LKSVFGETKTFKIFGDDYNTPDGTCVRDYVNVEDLAQAHRLALAYLNKENKSDVFNLGTEKGDSVKNIFDVCEKVLERKIPVEVVGRRDGDAEALYANANKAKTILGWQPARTIEDSIKSAYEWEAKRQREFENA